MLFRSIEITGDKVIQLKTFANGIPEKNSDIQNVVDKWAKEKKFKLVSY